jgi:dephospho-CoA kinase
MLRVGLTGGIACGKSRVLARFAARGLSTLDLDHVAHDALASGGAAHDEVVAAFGSGILDSDGHIDRKVLGRTVFGDAGARARLNAIVHPRIRAAESHWVAEEKRRGAHVAVTDAALLVESGVHLRFDRLIVVHCSADDQIRRLMSRDGIDVTAARARIDAQMPLEEKRRFGHVEIETSGEPLDTDRVSDSVGEELERTALGMAPPPKAPLGRALGALVHGPTHGPRGLQPVPLLTAIASWGGLELERAARLLARPVEGPWYRQADGTSREPSPATLAAPLVLWALTRAVADEDYVASAAASLARLTHTDRSGLADAVAVALALRQVLLDGQAPAAGWASACRRAETWGGASPSAGVEAEFAGLLSAAAAGLPSAEAPATVLAALRGIEALDESRT